MMKFIKERLTKILQNEMVGAEVEASLKNSKTLVD